MIAIEQITTATVANDVHIGDRDPELNPHEVLIPIASKVPQVETAGFDNDRGQTGKTLKSSCCGARGRQQFIRSFAVGGVDIALQC